MKEDVESNLFPGEHEEFSSQLCSFIRDYLLMLVLVMMISMISGPPTFKMGSDCIRVTVFLKPAASHISA